MLSTLSIRLPLVIHLEADLAGTTDKYSAGVNNSYQCNSGSSWNLKNSAGHGDGTLRVLNFTAQPFNVNGDTPSKDGKYFAAWDVCH